MSLTPVIKEKEVKLTFKILFESLTRDCQRLRRFIGWRGGGKNLDVYWNPTFHYWSSLEHSALKGRFWCCFGTQDPNKLKNLTIVCEANVPKQGIDRRTAASFLVDEKGHAFLAHNGKVGGGRKGIGKSKFLNFYQGALETVKWPDGNQTELIVVGEIESRHFGHQVAHFVREVERFKRGRKDQIGRLPLSSLPVSFTPEFSGRRKQYETSRKVVSVCDHGPLISALAGQLEKRSLKYGNDKARDLFVISSGGQVQILFEAKTDIETSSIYGGVGQLMLHGAAELSAPRRVLVLPEKPTTKTRLALEKLGVEVLKYQRDDKGFSFSSLDRTLRVAKARVFTSCAAKPPRGG